MTALTRNPTNPNPLQPNKFTLNFSRIPNVQFFCQAISIPGISTAEVPVPNPFVDVYAPGEKAIYDLLNITFIIDEELSSWLEIHDWIRAMTFPKEFEEYQQLATLNPYQSSRIPTRLPQYSDGIVTLYSSSNTPYYRFKFYDCFPTTVSTFLMNSSDSPETVMTADATFRYNYYDVEKLF